MPSSTSADCGRVNWSFNYAPLSQCILGTDTQTFTRSIADNSHDDGRADAGAIFRAELLDVDGEGGAH